MIQGALRLFLMIVLVGCVLLPHALVAGDAESVAPSLEELLLNGAVKGKVKRLWGGNDVKFVIRIEDGSKQGLKVIFRPEHLVDEWKHRKEISAYRLARLSGIDNVPVTVSRALPQKFFKNAGEKTLARLVFREGMLEGAVQVFVNGAHDPLGEEGYAWARDHLAALSEPAQPITMDLGEARQFSGLLLFDFLQSNPDRFSGGNLLQTDDGSYWFIDNADAYFGCTRPKRRVQQLSHFDRTQVAALRQLTKSGLEGELRALLGPKQVGRIWKRLQVVLQRVDGLIAEHGEDNVLF